MIYFAANPVGPITLTSVSTHSVNIQVEKNELSYKYHYFVVRRSHFDEICRITIQDSILNDCTDEYARHTDNYYEIYAGYNGGSSRPRTYWQSPLQEERTHLINITCIACKTLSLSMCPF